MINSILFKAKKIKTEMWVYGQYCYFLNPFTESGIPIRHYISNGTNIFTDEIDLETLCRYIGVKDKNGNMIFENDIVKHNESDTIGAVKWYQEDYVGWCVNDIQIQEQQFTLEMFEECEIIGNVFDNPELLQMEEKE